MQIDAKNIVNWLQIYRVDYWAAFNSSGKTDQVIFAKTGMIAPLLVVSSSQLEWTSLSLSQKKPPSPRHPRLILQSQRGTGNNPPQAKGLYYEKASNQSGQFKASQA